MCIIYCMYIVLHSAYMNILYYIMHIKKTHLIYHILYIYIHIGLHIVYTYNMVSYCVLYIVHLYALDHVLYVYTYIYGPVSRVPTPPAPPMGWGGV